MNPENEQQVHMIWDDEESSYQDNESLYVDDDVDDDDGYLEEESIHVEDASEQSSIPQVISITPKIPARKDTLKAWDQLTFLTRIGCGVAKLQAKNAKKRMLELKVEDKQSNDEAKNDKRRRVSQDLSYPSSQSEDCQCNMMHDELLAKQVRQVHRMAMMLRTFDTMHGLLRAEIASVLQECSKGDS